MNQELHLSPRKLIRLTIIGDHKIGKTTIINSLVNTNNYSLNIDITLRPDMYLKLYTKNNLIYSIQIWDTMGHFTLLPLNKYCYQNINCLIVVFDVSDFKSFQKIPVLYDRFIENSNYDNKNMPMLILLGNIFNNKIRQITKNDAELFAKTYNMLYFELNGIDSLSVNKVFENIFDELIKYLFESKPKQNIIDSCCNTPRDKLINDDNQNIIENKRSCFTKCFFS